MGSLFFCLPPSVAGVPIVRGDGGVARACTGICIGIPSV
jgi:hypothetical protein